MTTGVLTSKEYEEWIAEVILQQKRKPDLRQFIPSRPIKLAMTYYHPKIKDTSKVNWYAIGTINEVEGAPAGVESVSTIAHGFDIGWTVGVENLIMSRSLGDDIIQRTARVHTREAQNQIESYIINGKQPGKYAHMGTDKGVSGLYGNAGTTSTYTTNKWATQPGAYDCICDMISSAETKGFDSPYILVLHSALWSALYKTNATYATIETQQAKMIKEILGPGGAIVKSLHMPAPSGNDGTALLFAKDAGVCELLESTPITSERDPYVPSSKVETGILSWRGALRILDNGGIVKHATVDLAT